MSLTSDDARTIANAALHTAATMGLKVSCSVVDAHGHELHTHRACDASWFTAGLARNKAQTSVAMGQDTFDTAAMGAQHAGLLDLISDQLPFRLAILGGGIVVLSGDQVIGGVGVSGASQEDDVTCAQAGVASWRSENPDVK